jgi:hypothetical protein
MFACACGKMSAHVSPCMWVKLGVIEVGGLNLLKPRERERERERVCMAYGGRIVRLSSTEEKSLIFGLWMHVRTSLLLCFRNLIHGHLSSKSQVYRVCVYRPYKPTPPRFAPAIIWFASDTCTLYMC